MCIFYSDIYIFGETKESITAEAEAIVGDLGRIGMTLTIPEGAVSSTDEPLELRIRPCVNCQLKLPDGYVPASPVYFIEYEKTVKFKKKCILEILHYMHLDKPDDCGDLAFMTSTGYKGPSATYHFARAKGSDETFQLGMNHGKISLDHFCSFIIAFLKRTLGGK